MDTDIASADLQRLFGVNRTALNDLTKRRIIERGDKRGFYKLEASVSGHCAHLRGLAQGPTQRGRHRSIRSRRAVIAQYSCAPSAPRHCRTRLISVVWVDASASWKQEGS
jgi:hypothetical protein